MRAWKLIMIGFIGASVIAVGANLLARAAGDPPAPGRVEQVAEDAPAQAGPIQIDFGAFEPSESTRPSAAAGQPVSGGSAGADADQLRSDAGDDGSGDDGSGEGHSGEGHTGEEDSGEEDSGEEDSGEEDSGEGHSGKDDSSEDD
jgi:hypothetical protein